MKFTLFVLDYSKFLTKTLKKMLQPTVPWWWHSLQSAEIRSQILFNGARSLLAFPTFYLGKFLEFMLAYTAGWQKKLLCYGVFEVSGIL